MSAHHSSAAFFANALAGVLAAALAAAFAAAAPLGAARAEAAAAPTHVEFSSTPEGANVVVDGKLRGTTPLAIGDLSADERHHVRYEKAGFLPAHDFLLLAPGRRVVSHAELAPEKGLLLLTSEPAGCDITLAGLSLGVTPRLITLLETRNTYRLTLQKPGYQPRDLEVKFEGRKPLVRHENLLLDSGVITVASEPAGAAVTVNGVARGVTPVTVSGVAKGRASVVIEKEGFVSAKREIAMNAGETQNLFIALDGVPGSMALSSVPDGARFYLNNEMRGKSPLTLRDLKPGVYKVRAELENFEPVEREITVALGAALREEFRLSSSLGRLELKAPVGARIFIDGKLVGSAKSNDPDAELSNVFTVNGIVSGQHTILLRKRGFAEVVKHIEVAPAKTAKVVVKTMTRVFTPDVEIETNSGKFRGVLKGQTPEIVTIETSLGVERSFPRAAIQKFNLLEVPEGD